VYLRIHDGAVEIRDASGIWGKTTGEAQDAIHQELGDSKVRVVLIGPAGEKQIPYANMANDLSHISGRTGMGAVMGSKNLKAIACLGTGKIRMKDSEAVSAVAKRVVRDRKEYPLSYSLHWIGTPERSFISIMPGPCRQKISGREPFRGPKRSPAKR